MADYLLGNGSSPPVTIDITIEPAGTLNWDAPAIGVQLLVVTMGVLAGTAIEIGARESRDIYGGHKVPSRWMLQVLTSTLFLTVSLLVGQPWRLVPYLVLITTLLAASVIDFCQRRIPNRLVRPAFAISLLTTVLATTLGRVGSLPMGLTGATMFCSLLGAIHLAKPEGMGMGDVRLAAILGLYLGWVSDNWFETSWNVGVALSLASALGLGAAALTYGIEHRSNVDVRFKRHQIPFGPFLSAGTLIVVLGVG